MSGDIGFEGAAMRRDKGFGWLRDLEMENEANCAGCRNPNARNGYGDYRKW